jgi:probable F420-dependent oxidoreductase
MNIVGKGIAGRIGIWNVALGATDPARRGEISEAAAELDELGYGAIWLGGSPPLDPVGPLLDATAQIKIATGILNIWDHEAAAVGARWAELERNHPGRFLLGLGVSHGGLIGERYRRPYSVMREYLSALDAAPEPVPVGGRVLAALGPKMLELARDRAAGAHPYLVTVEHTAKARAILGDGALLAPELKVVLDADLDRARRIARGGIDMYLSLPNYVNSLLRLGFVEDDLRDGGSDRLVEGLVAMGDADAIAERVGAHLSAGADHVVIQALTGEPAWTAIPRDQWRRLAEALPLR